MSTNTSMARMLGPVSTEVGDSSSLLVPLTSHGGVMQRTIVTVKKIPFTLTEVSPINPLFSTQTQISIDVSITIILYLPQIISRHILKLTLKG